MTQPAQGSCLCGAVRFTVDGPFERFYLCHCSHCRKGTGSAHAATLFSTTARLAWLAGADRVCTFTLPGTRHTRSFCPTCGAALPSVQLAGTLLAVPAGSLDTPLPLQPAAHLFGASKADWDDALETVPMLPGLPE